ncbi:MAG: C40 family peptidase [Ignavibacteriae bacterium]|nr:C40 family peptidase [Ignavibacteriota bacterium]
MKLKILLIATIAITLTLLASSVVHAFSKGKPKKPTKTKTKSIVMKPIKPLLDTLSWMENLAIQPCPEDSFGLAAISLLREVNEWTKVRYRKGGNTKKGVDCSGFVKNIFKDAFSFGLPRTSREQFTLGDSVDQNELKAGDLVFFKSKRKRINHVGIYLGNGQFVHSARKLGVSIASLANSYYHKRFAGAKRILGFNSGSVETN